MKLHLPQSLRSALLACVSGLAAIGTTLGTGALTAGACGALTAGQARAEVTAISTKINQWGNYVLDEAEYDLSSYVWDGDTEGKLYLEGKNVTFTLGEGTVKVHQFESQNSSTVGSFEKSGDGTMQLANISKSPESAVISDGTFEVLSGGAKGFVSGTVEVSAGGTLKLSGGDALGYKNGGDYTDSITLTGSEAETAQLIINHNTTLSTNLVLEGYAVVSSTEDYTDDNGTDVSPNINTFGGSITATGTNNTISSYIQLREKLTVDVTGEDDTLAFSGTVGSYTGGDNSTTTAAFTKTGAGTLTFTETANASLGDFTISGGSVVNKGTLSLTGSVLIEEGSTFSLAANVLYGGSSFSNLGTLAFAGGALELSQDVIWNAINNNNGQFNLGTYTGDLALAGLNTRQSYAEGSGVVTFTNNALSLTWNGGVDGVWTQGGSGWLDAESAAQSFYCGDSVTFSGTSTATLGSDVHSASMTIAESASLTLSGAYTLQADTVANSGSLSVGSGTTLSVGGGTLGTLTNNGTLSISGDTTVASYDISGATVGTGVEGLGSIYVAEGATLTLSALNISSASNSKGQMWVLLRSGSGAGTIVIAGDFNAENDYVFTDANVVSGRYVITGELIANNWANNTSNAMSTQISEGSLLRVKGADGAYFNAKQTVQVDGSLIVDNTLTLGNSGGDEYYGRLEIGSTGTVVANKVYFNTATTSTYTSGVFLNGGKLYVGSDGIAATGNKIPTISLSNGTLGATTSWLTNLPVTLGSANAALTIDTTIQSVDNTSNLVASTENGATITFNGTATLAGSTIKTGEGTLALNGLLVANGNSIAVNQGALSLGSNFMYAGAVTKGETDTETNTTAYSSVSPLFTVAQGGTTSISNSGHTINDDGSFTFASSELAITQTGTGVGADGSWSVGATFDVDGSTTKTFAQGDSVTISADVGLKLMTQDIYTASLTIDTKLVNFNDNATAPYTLYTGALNFVEAGTVLNLKGGKLHAYELNVTDATPTLNFTNGAVLSADAINVTGSTAELDISNITLTDSAKLHVAKGGTLTHSFTGETTVDVTLKGGTYIKNGTASGAVLLGTITAEATEGNYTNVVTIKGESEPFKAAIKGDGDLTIDVQSEQMHFYSQNMGDFTGDLTFTGKTVNLGHTDVNYTTISHGGDLIIDGVTAYAMHSKTSIENKGNLSIESGSLTVRWSSNINLNGENDGKGRILISGGGMTLESGSVKAKGIEMTAGSLAINRNNIISLYGGATDASGNAVDALVLTGGTLTANADISLGYNATLGGVILSSGSYTTTVDGVETSATGTLSIGDGNTTTAFTGTVINNAVLTLNGSLSVADESVLTKVTNTLTTGQTGYDNTTYYLVKAQETTSEQSDATSIVPTVTVGSSTVTVGETSKILTVANGSVSYDYATNTTYHIGSDAQGTAGVKYSDLATIGSNAGTTFDTISLDGGKLVLAAGEQITTETLSLTADSTISGVLTSGAHTGLGVGITSTHNLTIQGTGNISQSTGGSHGNYFGLAGDINLGSAKLIIDSGLIRLGTLAEGVTSTANITAGSIEVNKGAILEIFRADGTLGTAASPTVLTLNGGTLHVQQVHNDGTLAFGTLTVNQLQDEEGNPVDSTIQQAGSGGKISFTSLAGDGALSIKNTTSTTIGTTENYTGNLAISGGNVTITTLDGAGNVSMSGGTTTLKGLGSSYTGTLSISGGVLNYQAGDSNTNTMKLEMSGGEIDLYSGNVLVGTLELAKTASGETSSSTIKGGGKFQTSVSGEGNLTFGYTTNCNYDIYNADGQNDLKLSYSGNFNVVGGDSGSVKAVNLGNGASAAKLSGSGQVNVSNKGTLNLVEGTISKTGGVTVDSTSTLTIAEGGKVDVSAASIENADGKTASYTNGSITSSGISGGELSNASLTVSDAFALSGVTVTDCSFSLDAALTVGDSTTFSDSTAVTIGTTGALVNAETSKLALSGTNTLWLDVEADSSNPYIEFNNATLTSTQLQGDISGAFALEASNSLLELLAEKKSITLVFNTAGTSLSQALQASLDDSSGILTASVPATTSEEGIMLTNEETPVAGLTFTLGSTLANAGYTLTQTEDGNYLLSSSDAIPEPTTATLSLLALAALAARRRRK